MEVTKQHSFFLLNILKENWFWLGTVLGGLLAVLSKLLIDFIITCKERRNFRKTSMKIISDNLEEFFKKLRNEQIDEIVLCELEITVYYKIKTLETWLLKVDSSSLPRLQRCYEDAKTVCKYLRSEDESPIQKKDFFELYFTDREKAMKIKPQLTAILILTTLVTMSYHFGQKIGLF